MDFVVQSPKLSADDRRLAWYPYYAGYSEGFARWALQALGATEGAVLYDPWNGAGTTLLAGMSYGMSGGGLDLNPAMVAIAAARTGPKDDMLDLVDRAKSLRLGAGRPKEVHPEDALLDFFSPPTVKFLRRIEAQLSKGEGRSLIRGDLHDLSPRQALTWCLLFRVCREASNSNPSNPTWRRRPKEVVDVSADALLQSLGDEAEKLGTYLLSRPGVSSSAVIRKGDSRDTYPLSSKFDFLLTSPPYLTRIDYAIKMGVELAVLNVRPSELRDDMLGTPLTSHRKEDLIVPAEAAGILDEIQRHGSKASKTYYSRFFRSYFVDYEKSLTLITQNAASGAAAGIVVQNSYYKEHLIDLAQVTSDIMLRLGWKELGRHDFPVRHSMAHRNTASRAHFKDKTYAESFVRFRKAL